MHEIKSKALTIQVIGSARCLWSYRVRGAAKHIEVAPPSFEVDGHAITAALRKIAPSRDPQPLANGTTEFAFEGTFAKDPSLSLEIIFRVPDDNPIVRFCYVLKSKEPRRLTKTSGRDAMSYLGLSFKSLPSVKEVRFSEFNEMVHSFTLSERPVEDSHFDDGLAVMGPMIVAARKGFTMLAAYEHGSQVPDAFVEFRLAPGRAASLAAVKGNYYSGQALGPGSPCETIWLQLGAVLGDDSALACAYRQFVLRHITLNAESRKPYIFYNTWAYQERNKWWNNKKYLDSMHQERILAEIDAAHRMGIDVFVLDTGWYEKTGDWRVNTARFPDSLQAVREKLSGYGMKLGLWFNPLAAAVSSKMLKDHEDCIVSWDGRKAGPGEIWETEQSYNLCLVSRYWEAFADELIRLVREVGVTYFKWDAIGQYGCNDPGHWHGDASATASERANNYAFNLGRYMSRVVDKLCAACPEAIVDFDITEGHRYVGLGWLAAGKYFLINNGPYYGNYNIPIGNVWSNIFVYPGAARGWICRTPLDFDKWIPSVLFLTHYLPDDPARSQVINIASLILGQNGIWGDPLSVSPEGIERFGRLLGLYKQVRDDITQSYPVRCGSVAGSPEVHEKINPATGRGAVCIFSSAAGRYTYVTANGIDSRIWHTDGIRVETDKRGRAKIEATFDGPGAGIVYFGVS